MNSITVQDKIKALNKNANTNQEEKAKIEFNDYRKTKAGSKI